MGALFVLLMAPPTCCQFGAASAGHGNIYPIKVKYSTFDSRTFIWAFGCFLMTKRKAWTSSFVGGVKTPERVLAHGIFVLRICIRIFRFMWNWFPGNTKENRGQEGERRRWKVLFFSNCTRVQFNTSQCSKKKHIFSSTSNQQRWFTGTQQSHDLNLIWMSCAGVCEHSVEACARYRLACECTFPVFFFPPLIL